MPFLIVGKLSIPFQIIEMEYFGDLEGGGLGFSLRSLLLENLSSISLILNAYMNHLAQVVEFDSARLVPAMRSSFLTTRWSLVLRAGK